MGQNKKNHNYIKMDTEKVYLWDIDDEEGFGVFRISQVLEPAMESDFIAFSKQLVIEPGPTEAEDEFIGRCMKEETGKYPQDQAFAICKSKWDNKDLSVEKLESFSDYPEAAKRNAERAIKYKEENNIDCGTQVGWTRARQLANGEPISEETINRMSAFRRHEQNKDVPYDEGCGGIMWDAWGGDEGIEWAARRAEDLRLKYEDDEVKKKRKKNNYKGSINFSVDEEKMRVFGAILIPNKKFYRSDLEGYAMFTKEAVEKARLTFKKNNNMFSVNIEHSDKGAPAFLLEDWIVEASLEDKSYSKWNLKFEEGTWVGVMQITDKTYWNDFVKSGKVRGFSIELDGESVIQKKLLNMDKKKIEKLGEATLQDGTQIYWEGETLDLGVAIFMDAELTQPAPDGEHVDASGNVVVTRDGLVVEIRPAEEMKGEEKKEDEKPSEFALKSEVTSLIADLQSRIETLESELLKKNEELTKEVKEMKSNTPGGKSFVFKKKEMEKQNLSKSSRFSERLKKTYQELGKL
jgi:hypothetical protein